MSFVNILNYLILMKKMKFDMGKNQRCGTFNWSIYSRFPSVIHFINQNLVEVLAGIGCNGCFIRPVLLDDA